MDAATVAWLWPPATGQTPADTQAREGDRRALEEWARARGISLVLPRSGGATVIPVDIALGDKVEADLDRAREAVTAADTAATEHALARAEALLRAHPELPHAAWLLAEVERGWAARWSRLGPADPDRARAAWRSAAALDGGRSSGVGEISAEAPADVEVTIVLDGEGDLLVDGTRASQGALKRPEGEHQIVLSRAGEVVWAEWVTLVDHEVVRIAVPEAPPCSTQDLARASVEEGAVRGRGVRCAEWVAAVPSARARTVQVARCERDRCGPLVEWSLGGPGAPPPEPGGHGGHWPGWATWTLVGVGIAAAAGITLIATGAFRSTSTTEIDNGGLRQH